MTFPEKSLATFAYEISPDQFDRQFVRLRMFGSDGLPACDLLLTEKMTRVLVLIFRGFFDSLGDAFTKARIEMIADPSSPFLSRRTALAPDLAAAISVQQLVIELAYATLGDAMRLTVDTISDEARDFLLDSDLCFQISALLLVATGELDGE